MKFPLSRVVDLKSTGNDTPRKAMWFETEWRVVDVPRPRPVQKYRPETEMQFEEGFFTNENNEYVFTHVILTILAYNDLHMGDVQVTGDETSASFIYKIPERAWLVIPRLPLGERDGVNVSLTIDDTGIPILKIVAARY